MQKLNENQSLELRMSGIGGSDAAAVLGLSRWKTPVEVYMEKIGEAKPVEETEAMHFGKVLESVVADEFALRTGKKIRKKNETIRRKGFEFQMAHIDRAIVGERAGLECKTAGRWYSNDEWGETGTDQVPIDYLLQCQHYLMVTGWDVWYLAVLLAGNEFRYYILKPDTVIHAKMHVRESEFWARVREKNPPPPSNPFDCNLLYPRETGESVLASPQASSAILELQQIAREKAKLKKTEDELKTKVQAEMQNALILQGFNGEPLATWKNQEKEGYEVKPWQGRVFRLANVKE